MNASTRGILLAGVAVAIVVSFQNCGQNQFSSLSDGTSAKASGQSPATGGLVPMDNSDGDNGSLGQGILVDDGGAPTPSPSPAASPGPRPSPTPGGTPAASPTPVVHGHGHDGHDDVESDGDDLNLCVVEGPGRSMRIGYSEEHLGETRGAPHDVCMSKHACIDIVGRSFKVKMLFPQPCKGLLHNQAVHLDDGQIEKLVEDMKK